MKKLRFPRVFKRLDRYLISMYLGTFFYCLLLVMAIVVVFDYNEKFDRFQQHGAPGHAIIFDYFLNFIPYFGVKFSPFFIFIAVVYFTSKLASHTEIIAMLSGGMSFHRLLRPYMVSAVTLSLMVFTLSSYVIPPANKIRLDFEDKYVKKVTKDYVRNVQLELEPGVIVYIERYDDRRGIGYRFFMESYEGKQLVSKLTSERITMIKEQPNRWKLTDYTQRDFLGLNERVSKGYAKDTTIVMDPSEFFIVKGFSEQLTTTELRRYLDRQKQRGVANLKEYEIEYHRRFSFPFSILVLTIIALSLASRKVRGGTGLHLGLGLLVAFSYILFDTLSGAFALSGNMEPMLAVWIPNILFSVIAVILYVTAPK